jgi:hypothetical protein
MSSSSINPSGGPGRHGAVPERNDQIEFSLFTPRIFLGMQTSMHYVVKIRSHLQMTRRGGPMEDVAH